MQATLSTVTGTTSTPASTAAWHAGVQRRRVALLSLLCVAVSLASVRLVLTYELLPPVALIVWLVGAAIAWRPRLGLYVAFLLVCMFEGGGPDALMLPGYFLLVAPSITLGIFGLIVSPLELLLVLTLASWLIHGTVMRRLRFRGGHLGWPVFLFFLSLVLGTLRGALTGGDLNIGLWESRALFVAVICYVLAANTIRTTQHLQQLLAVTVLGTGFFAAEGAYRRVVLINAGLLGPVREFYFAHETVVFLAALPILVLAQQVFGAPRWQRVLGPLLAALSLFTLLATERRAGQIAFIIAFMVFAVVLLAVHRRAFVLLVVPAILCTMIYLPLFWRSTGVIGQPARAVRSLVEPDPRDAASNFYRDMEKINVRATILANPLLGVGFGREFYFVVPLPNLSWWAMWRYEPHHNVLWVWLKTGAIGFIAFFTLIGSVVARSAHFVRTLRQPHQRTFATLVLCVTVATLVFSWVDLGLVSGRVTVLLGTLWGGLAVLDRLHDETRAPRAAGAAGAARVAGAL